MPLSPKGFPVLLSFDIDAETMWTARDPKNAERPIVMSQGAYGWKVGMPRILELLGRYGLRVTFFVPGLVMEQRPAMVEAILKGGHEIAHHSWSHAWIVNLTLTLLEELIKYILGHSGVWLARCDEVADTLRPVLRAEAGA
jgi:peptidoglycan/xylan/chitin deacetylase (PgdA/CDA1 family)